MKEFSSNLSTADEGSLLEEKLIRAFKNHSVEMSIKERVISFFDLGFDSSQLMKLVNSLEQQFQLQLNPALLFQYNTFEKLISYLESVLPKNLEDNTCSGEFREQDLAIIGMSFELPDAKELDELWTNLSNEKNSIKAVNRNWPYTPYPWGGYLEDISGFDPWFFNIPPFKAVLMDPQERLFLANAWHCLEDAGYAQKKEQNIGVIAAVMFHSYQYYGVEQKQKNLDAKIPQSSAASIANRVSYALNLTGPSFSLDSMGSSSLTALDLASRYLAAGEVDAMLVGGVNLCSHPFKLAGLLQDKLLSPSGVSAPFGQSADGYVPGEGVVVFLLKNAKKAMADGDSIYALIKGIAINHGGESSGFTVPNAKAQAQVLHAALQKADIKAQQVHYVEAHGAGTYFGDPIEFEGIQQVYGQRLKDKPLYVGSIKGNIGHLESAAALASILKVIAQFQHNCLAPSLHASPFNPALKLSEYPIHIVTQALPHTFLEFAGISSFGAGGSNGHLILKNFSKNLIKRTKTGFKNESYWVDEPSAHDPQPKPSLHAWGNEIKNIQAYQRRWIKQEMESLDLSPYSSLLVFLNSWQQEWVKALFASIEVNQPIYYVFVDDQQQFKESLHSLTGNLVPLIYYFAGMQEDEFSTSSSIRSQSQALAAFIDLVTPLHSFPELTLYLYSNRVHTLDNELVYSTQVPDIAQALKKEHPHWMIECVDIAIDFNEDSWPGTKPELAKTQYPDQGQCRKIDLLKLSIHSISLEQSGGALPVPSEHGDAEYRDIPHELLLFNQALIELDQFCFHLIKYKLVTQGLIWSEYKPSFISGLSDYADYFIFLLTQLKEFEKTHHADTNKNQIKTLDSLLQQRLELSKKYPSMVPFFNLLAVCADHLVSVLRGEITIQEVVFPYGHDHLVTAIRQDNPLANFYNQLIAEQVDQLVAVRDRPVRILELGAGLGAATTTVLNLCAHNVHYIFSDTNPQFLSQAMKTFGHHSGFQAHVLDINKPILNQTVDVIIAANVLHTAGEIRSCLMELRSLLNPGGLLLITAPTANSLFLASSFGLFKPGQGVQEDQTLQAGAWMTVSTWKKMLEDLDFNVRIHPTSLNLPQSMFIVTFPPLVKTANAMHRVA